MHNLLHLLSVGFCSSPLWWERISVGRQIKEDLFPDYTGLQGKPHHLNPGDAAQIRLVEGRPSEAGLFQDASHKDGLGEDAYPSSSSFLVFSSHLPCPNPFLPMKTNVSLSEE